MRVGLYLEGRDHLRAIGDTKITLKGAGGRGGGPTVLPAVIIDRDF